jgi:MFS family permease
MPLSPSWYQFGIGVFASLGSYLYGYDLGVIAEVVASPTFSAKFKADSTQTGLVVSMFTTGAFFGAAFAGPSGDYLGRRLTIVAGSVIFCLGGGLQTGAQNVSFLYAGRFIAGLGVGYLVMVRMNILLCWLLLILSHRRLFLYTKQVSANRVICLSCGLLLTNVTELCHPKIRGRVTALQQFMLGVGALVASWVSYGESRNSMKTYIFQRWRPVSRLSHGRTHD